MTASGARFALWSDALHGTVTQANAMLASAGLVASMLLLFFAGWPAGAQSPPIDRIDVAEIGIFSERDERITDPAFQRANAAQPRGRKSE
jgi:hypothetical protein